MGGRRHLKLIRLLDVPWWNSGVRGRLPGLYLLKAIRALGRSENPRGVLMWLSISYQLVIGIGLSNLLKFEPPLPRWFRQNHRFSLAHSCIPNLWKGRWKVKQIGGRGKFVIYTSFRWSCSVPWWNSGVQGCLSGLYLAISDYTWSSHNANSLIAILN